MKEPPVREPPQPEPPVKAEQGRAEGASGQKDTPDDAFQLVLDTERVEASLQRLTEELRVWALRGRHTKVRLKFRGKQLGPDLPLVAFVAAQGLTFYWSGLLRALLVNVAGNAVLSVELVNDSEKEVDRGRERLLQGDVDGARTCFERALEMEPDSARAHLNLGTLHRLAGRRLDARKMLRRARELDPDGPVGKEAGEVLTAMGGVSGEVVSERPGERKG